MFRLRLHIDRRQRTAATRRCCRGRLLVQRLWWQMVTRRRMCCGAIVNQLRLIGQRQFLLQLLLLLCRCRCRLQLLQLLGVHGASCEEWWRLQPAKSQEIDKRGGIKQVQRGQFMVWIQLAKVARLNSIAWHSLCAKSA